MHPDILSELDVARLEKLIIRFENEATFWKFLESTYLKLK
jgi:hypothetical protein